MIKPNPPPVKNVEPPSAMEKAQAAVEKQNQHHSVQTKKAATNLKQLLDNPRIRNQIVGICSRHISPEKLMRVAMMMVTRQPELQECHPMTLIAALIDCAQLGLVPFNQIGHVYFISYLNRKAGIREVQLQLGYKGIIELAMRSGKFSHIDGDVICENDEVLEYERGDVDKFRLKPSFPNPRGELRGAYAKAVLRDGNGHILKVIDMDVINDARSRSLEYAYWLKRDKTGKNPIWVEHFHAMAIKTAIRRMAPFLSLTTEASVAIASDAERELGKDGAFRNEIYEGLSGPMNLEIQSPSGMGENNIFVEEQKQQPEAEQNKPQPQPQAQAPKF